LLILQGHLPYGSYAKGYVYIRLQTSCRKGGSTFDVFPHLFYFFCIFRFFFWPLDKRVATAVLTWMHKFPSFFIFAGQLQPFDVTFWAVFAR